MKKGFFSLIILLICVTTLSGCGGPKADVPIFIMGEAGMPSDVTDMLEETLKKRLGETPTVLINSTPMFSLEKMIVELAAGGNGIMILTQEQFLGVAQQGGVVSLDDMFDPKEYPSGVVASLYLPLSTLVHLIWRQPNKC